MAYAKEFEKWLMGNTSTEEECTDLNCNDSTSMEEDEPAPQLLCTQGPSSRRSSGFQDEPPILEPESLPLSKDQLIESKPTDDNRNVLKYCNETLKKQISSKKLYQDSYGFKKKMPLKGEQAIHSKSRETENIFDKFSMLSENEDFPPPLIPSHEAHLTTVDDNCDDLTEKSYATLQNLSPNFCAMEADSTSELIQGDERMLQLSSDSTSHGNNILSNDLRMECDSTCMLSLSPHIVSSVPTSNKEVDNLSETFYTNLSYTNLNNNNQSQETYTSLIPFSELTQMDGFVTITRNCMPASDLENNNLNISGVTELDKDCPKLVSVMHHIDNEKINNFEEMHSPPQLSAIIPAMETPALISKRKRHTIDTMESCSSAQNCKVSFKSFENGSPNLMQHPLHEPSLMHGSHKSFVKKQESKMSKKRDKHLSFKHSSHSLKNKSCRSTLEIVDLTQYESHLSKELRQFINKSCQLSVLQKRMHQLVFLLFPQLLTDLAVMSPESLQFETLLNNLVRHLDCQEEETECMNAAEIGSSDHSVPMITALQERLQFHSTKNDSLSSVFDNSCNASLRCNHRVTESKSMESNLNDNYSSSCGQHSNLHSNLELRLGNNAISNEHFNQNNESKSVILKMSSLLLNEDSEKIFKKQPSVLVNKNPQVVHKKFFKLSCQVLQLLLPDMNVHLMKELSDSPSELINFIDSVISSNSRQLSSHFK